MVDLTPCPLCRGVAQHAAAPTTPPDWAYDRSGHDVGRWWGTRVPQLPATVTTTDLRLYCPYEGCQAHAKGGLEVEQWAPMYLWPSWPAPDPINLGTLSEARKGLLDVVRVDDSLSQFVEVEGVPMGVGKTRSTADDIAQEVAAGGNGRTYYAPRHDELAAMGDALKERGVDPFVLEGSSRSIGPDARPWAAAGVPPTLIEPREKDGARPRRAPHQPVLCAHQLLNKPAPWVDGLREEANWQAKGRGESPPCPPIPPLPGPGRVDEQPGLVLERNDQG